MLSSACGNKLPEDISSCCFDNNNNKPALIPPSESDESFSSAEQSTRSESGELEMDWSLLDSEKDVLRGKKSVLVDNSLSKARIRTGRVAWGELGVRLFSVMPGDHPDCLQGPPLTLEWKYFDQVNTTIDIFEEQRPQRKHHDDLRLHWIVRTRLLKSLGFGIAELTEAQNDSHRTRQKRDLTLKRVNYDWFYEFQQSLLRKVGRLFVHRKVLTTSY